MFQGLLTEQRPMTTYRDREAQRFLHLLDCRKEGCQQAKSVQENGSHVLQMSYPERTRQETHADTSSRVSYQIPVVFIVLKPGDPALLIGFETRLSKVKKGDRSATMLIHLRQDLLGGVSHTQEVHHG